MKSVECRSGARGLVAAVLTSVWFVSSAAAAGLELNLPGAAALPRFGIRAAWAHQKLDAPMPAGTPPARAAAAPLQPRATNSGDAPAVSSDGPASQEHAGGPAPASSEPAGGSASLSPVHSPGVQAWLVERTLLTRTVQRVAAGDLEAPSSDRRKLALRALELLQSAAAGPAVPGDRLRQIGLERRRIGGIEGVVSGSPAGLELVTLRDRGGAVRRQQFRVGGGQKPTLHFSLMTADAGFSRFADLSAEERSWAGAMRGMRRLEFGGEKLALAGGRAELGTLQLTDGKARARRLSFGFTGGGWSVQALSQRVADTFQRLGDLPEADRKLFGAERGISRDALELGYAFTGERRLSASSLSLRAAAGAAQRRQIEYRDGKDLQLKFSSGRVDSRFDRIADLLAADRGVLAPLRGMRWSDLSANVRLTRWLSTENQWFRGTSLDTGQRSTQLRQLWTLQLAPRSKLILQHSLLETPLGRAGRRRAQTQSLRLEQWLSGTLFFTGFRESGRTAVSDSLNSLSRRLALHLNTAPGRPLQWTADYGTAQGPDRKGERTFQWSLALPVRRGLTLQAKGDRRKADGRAGAGALTLGLTGPITRDWTLGLNFNQAHPEKGSDTRDLGLRLAYSGLKDSSCFKETHLVWMIGDTQGLPSAIPVPLTAKAPAPPRGTGPAGHGQPPAMTRRVHTVVLETRLRGRPLALGYSAAAGTAGGIAYRLATDPKRRLQAEALREVRDLGHTSLVARQRYALRAGLGRASQLVCSYETHPELSPGRLLPGHAQSKLEAQTKFGGLALLASVARDEDRLKRATSTLTSLSLAGSIDPKTDLRLSFTQRRGGCDPSLPVRNLFLELDRQPNNVLRASLRAEWRDWNGPHADELAWQLDLTAVF